MHPYRRRSLKLLQFKLNFVKFILYYALYLHQIRQHRSHRWWVRPIWRRRQQEGVFHTVMPQLMLSGDIEYFMKYFRMSPTQFHTLVDRLTPRLQKYPRNRTAISPAERVSIALRFLASGDCVSSIAMTFRVGIATASTIIQEVCCALYDELQPEYLPAPSREIWDASEAGFRSQWQFPGCIGALDGKHILLQCPSNSGSKFYNYKGDFSLVLLAVVDANYRFLYVDIGAYGSQSDGGVFKACSLGEALYSGTLALPTYSVNHNMHFPACLIGDSAFQLHRHLMKPYPSRGLTHSRRIFNYRLCRARRCVENAFGILACRWRVLLRPLSQAPHNVEKIVKAVVVLHNYLRCAPQYAPTGYGDIVDSGGNIINGEWRNDCVNDTMALQPLPLAYQIRQHTEDAKRIREQYRRFFTSDAGQVEWQWRVPGIDKDLARGELQ